jgi:hypothetical protein
VRPLKAVLAPELIYKPVALAWRQRPSSWMLGMPPNSVYKEPFQPIRVDCTWNKLIHGKASDHLFVSDEKWWRRSKGIERTSGGKLATELPKRIPDACCTELAAVNSELVEN